MPTHPSRPFVLRLDDIDPADEAAVAVVGGKGAGLAALARLDGVRVPDAVCVTTDAYERSVARLAPVGACLTALARLSPADHAAIRAQSIELRDLVARVELPDDVRTAITQAVADLGGPGTFAVRSSATAEDRPDASFAGQHDSFLGVTASEVVARVRDCWASLFAERAVTYRLRTGLPPDDAQMAVVVQRMVAADASGVLFTADPRSGNRTITTVEAVRGLGDALVAGRADADVYRVRGDAVVETRTAGARPVLADAQVLALARLGRRIEAHRGGPQDVEWCLTGDTCWTVQSRPITTLFPPPASRGDAEGTNRVYVSVGHGQMMTDAMKPLGLSMWLRTTPAPAVVAGGRLFVDVTATLASPARRPGLLEVFGRSDPLVRDALETVVARAGFLPEPPGEPAHVPAALDPPPLLDPEPAVVAELVEANNASVEVLARSIAATTGEAVFDVVADDLQELRRLLFDRRSLAVIFTATAALTWLRDHLDAWLGDPGAADALTQSAPNDVTAEMGRALLDVADAIRPHPEVVAYLRRREHEGHVLDGLLTLPGGGAARQALERFLDRYGMRCVGEIDITRPRWAERPEALMAPLLGHVEHFEPGAAGRLLAQGQRTAAETERDVLERLRSLPDGERKAAETKQAIDRVRAFIGYREYPKYGLVRRYFLYKQAFLREAGRLVDEGVLATTDDVFFLDVDELREVVRTRQADRALIERRRRDQRGYESLRPPRVLTSEGEGLHGAYRGGLVPDDALAGLGVSAGSVEGRARVITDVAEADLEPGDILVTVHTDPSWSPLFVTVAGLVTEVGGLLTHGSVVAREYGLPAVVGVDGATERIADGRRIRVDGTTGIVELLD